MFERIRLSVTPGVVVLFASVVAVSVAVALFEPPIPADRPEPAPDEEEEIAWV